jgi:E3 ubiquitin-protein ligase SIAH1
MDFTTASAEVANIFQCPVCCDYIMPSLLQCHNGHIICTKCHRKSTRCPVCRGPLGNIQNLAMEEIASALMLPCNYSTSGCAVSLHHTERTEHEEMCEFRPYSCPLQGQYCTWQGSLEEVLPHLVMFHSLIIPPEYED